MKHLILIGSLLLMGAAVTVSSCRKEDPVSVTGTAQAAKTPERNPAIELLMQSKIATYTEPHCTPMGGRQCNIRGGFGCLVLFPPQSYQGFEYIPVRFYEPVETGQGETGTQMAIELLGEGHLLETVLGPQESDEPVLSLYHAYAQHLNCTAIEVVNHPYTPVYDAQHPYGYVVLDCIAHH
jgi:hypothetical protein